MRELIREDQKRRAKEKLDDLLLKDLDSGEPLPATPAKAIQVLPDFKLNVRTMLTGSQGVSRPAGPHPLDAFPLFQKIKGINSRGRVLRTSLQRHTRPRAEVEQRLAAFLATQPRHA